MFRIEEIEDGLRITVEVPCRKMADGRIRQQKSLVGSSATEAKRIAKEMERLALKRAVALENAGPSWSEVVDDYEMTLRKEVGIRIGQATCQDKVAAIRAYTSLWTNLPIESLTINEVEECLLLLKEEGKSFSRAKYIKSAISAVFDYARRRQLGVRTNPAIEAKIPIRKTVREQDILNLEEIRTLLRAARQSEHPWYPVWSFALLSGMRSGELFALKWTDIDLQTDQISVNKSFNNRFNTTGPTKGGYSRVVPICAELRALICELKLKSSDEFVLPRLPYWARGEAARILRTFCVGIGLKSVKFHALRACFATQLLRNSVAPAVVMKIAGWKDLKTMQRYIRLAGIEFEGATNSLRFLPPDRLGKLFELNEIR